MARASNRAGPPPPPALATVCYSPRVMPSDARLARAVRFPRVVNIEDLRELARKRLPALVFSYIDGGAEGEITLRENARAFADVTFRPRQCVAVPGCDLRTTV